ncbi:putative F-box protein At3g21120 [Prosopis cineraria]|uniref:putative F-box protein At3g21120 n=1 Tax=Prosopis cineraria TaxID=364024 RepID=UPI0024105D7E|nr:putative F-box protein At3g21120 [Prosopis cineraria]
METETRDLLFCCVHSLARRTLVGTVHCDVQDPFFLVAHYEADGSERRRTISSPRHHQKHSQMPSGGARPFSYLCFLDQRMRVQEAQNAPLIGFLLGVSIIGCCNGLLCFQPNNASIFIWNPATREVRKALVAVDISLRESFKMGFGFSSIANDYKIVRMRVSLNNERFIRMQECNLFANLVDQVQVYSLSTGSWSAIEFGNLDGIYLVSNGFPANGAIFWLGFMLNSGENDEIVGHLIVSFDVATEVFTLIPLPASVPRSYRNKLTVHENNLALLSHTFIGNYESSLIDLWVMNEGTGASGGRWNWTKKYSTSPYPCILIPGTIWRNEIVCHSVAWHINAAEREGRNGEQNIFLVNLSTNEVKTFAISRNSMSHDIFNYVESLAPVGNNHIEEI